ncbi:hypothetical protein E2C01_053397 [Portunus trituberculatus]|uniref:Uncharacterized protein n=1 Tax=Portunus trituberculatus TaxID=210409 RepID=A0A5B7GQN7_PORTR|nr:hypothetical protein [Portunus trituberculatus]
MTTETVVRHSCRCCFAGSMAGCSYWCEYTHKSQYNAKPCGMCRTKNRSCEGSLRQGAAPGTVRMSFRSYVKHP